MPMSPQHSVTSSMQPTILGIDHISDHTPLKYLSSPFAHSTPISPYPVQHEVCTQSTNGCVNMSMENDMPFDRPSVEDYNFKTPALHYISSGHYRKGFLTLINNSDLQLLDVAKNVIRTEIHSVTKKKAHD